MISSMIGRVHHVVLDCPDPDAVAAFYSALLGLPVTYRDDDWVVVAASDTSSGLAFQRAPGNQPPIWPDPSVPSSSTSASWSRTSRPQVPRCSRWARQSFTANVYADPAGHPLCLI
jgi:catechol 2,3-dioxygenase-like lactoylglutathione lyase family enzyme